VCSHGGTCFEDVCKNAVWSKMSEQAAAATDELVMRGLIYFGFEDVGAIG